MDTAIVKNIKGAVPFLLLFLVLGLPVLMLLLQWWTTGEDTVLYSIINRENLLLIGKSLLMSAIVALLATFTGTICAFLLYKFQFPFSGFYRLTLLLPLLISPYIFAVAWKDGFFWLLGNTAAIYSEAGVILVQTFVFFPLAMLIIGSALSQIHAGYEEAGLMTVPFRKMMVKIVFPLIRPALTISFLLILIFSMSDFSVPAFFGVRTFTTEIFTQFSALYNFPLAIGQSVILLLICLLLMLSEARYLSDAPFFSVSVKGSVSKKYHAGKRKIIVHGFFWVLLISALLLPVLMLTVQSLTGRTLFFAQAWELIRPAAFQSVKLAFAGACITTITGLWTAYGKERRNHKLPDLLLLLTFIVPSTVLGIALIRYYNLPALNFIYGTSLILLIAYLGKFGFIASRIIGNGIKQIPVSFEEAASVMGISSKKTFLKISLPLLIPSLFTAFVLSFILCLGELGATMMVYPPGMELMQVKTFAISANAPQALTSSMTLINLWVTVFLLLLLFVFGKWMVKKFQYV
ncbi:iron ABC transporter permease [Algoriphagus sp. AGSA1]|uniref:ABC transporter permease n=1 Tax=unclassified Algoriphagus TaxID=2641541 RepID=UPI00177DC77F|nr:MULTISPECIES: iron ABC transporter permease [unclassified Algoriphagus]MCE7056232.1 iron ABC transporter permease [Algoriphagus sp. AGSA1]